jgi:hypothetical protein
MVSYKEFVLEMHKKMTDFTNKERVCYLLRHPVYLKKLGGNNQMLADYLWNSIKDDKE